MNKNFKEWIATKKYAYPMREAAERFLKHKVLREGMSMTPQTGIYFWVPLPKGKWDFVKFFDSQVDNLQHDTTWNERIVPEIRFKWNLNPMKTSQIRGIYASVPRGRVSKSQTEIFHHHGGDAPSLSNGTKMPQSQLDSLIRKEFGLPSVKSMADDHERMLQDDVMILQSVLGNLGLAGVDTSFDWD